MKNSLAERRRARKVFRYEPEFTVKTGLKVTILSDGTLKIIK
jgi:hypothetical protein